MAIYVTGDIHGNPVRLSKDSFNEQIKMKTLNMMLAVLKN